MSVVSAERRVVARPRPATLTPRAAALAFWLLVAISIALAAAVRWRLLDVPLERDEGEFAYMAQQWLRGVPPYESGYAMKLPGIYAAYAVVLSLCGETIRGVHQGLILVNALSILLVGLLGRRLYGPIVGGLAALAFASLAICPGLQGASGQAEHFVLLPALAGLLVIATAFARPAVATDNAVEQSPAPPGAGAVHPRAGAGPKIAAAALGGLLLGMALTIKQHGALFALAAGVYVLGVLFWQRRAWSAASWLAVPAMVLAGTLPLCALVGYFAAQGLFDKLWLWTVDISRQYAAGGLDPGSWHYLADTLWALFIESPVLWTLGCVGLTSLAWNPASRRQAGFMLLWAIASAATVFASGKFFGHYFVLVLPALAILAALGACTLASSVTNDQGQVAIVGAGLVVFGVALFGWLERVYLFEENTLSASRRLYGTNPFPEAVELANYLAAHSGPDDSVLVLGSEPQIYFYLGRRAATGHIYMYPLMSGMPFAAGLQRELVAEVEAARPAYILYVKVEMSWSGWVGADQLLFEWFARYREANYTMVGIFDIWSGETTNTVFGKRALTYRPLADNPSWIGIYRRNDFVPRLPDEVERDDASPLDK